MSWQRPNIGSRVTREGHARFWERPEVEFLRATRRFSTTIRQPSRSESSPAITRLMMSGGVLALVGTTNRIGLDGNDCAFASGLGTATLTVSSTVPIWDRWRNAEVTISPFSRRTSERGLILILH